MSNINESKIRFRKKINPFTQVSNDLIDDERLSVQARFLYILINRSITNEDWTFYKSNLQRKMNIKSENTFDKYWKELKKAGYLIQHKFKDERGRWAYEYEIMDSVADFEPMKTPKKESKNHTPNFEGVEISEGGKVGAYNKTYENNTNLNNNNNLSICKADEGLIDSQIHEEDSVEVRNIMKVCQAKNFKLSKKHAQDLLFMANDREIISAILKATETGTTIIRPFDYLLEMISNKNNKVTTPAPASTKPEEVNAKSFNNFEAREYDYDSLEKKLLGWDN